jgi:MFS family permease
MLAYSYNYSPWSYNLLNTGIAFAICFILALIAAIVLFFVFLPAKKEPKQKGFLLWAHRALNFRSMFSLGLLKFLYLISVCFLVLYGLYMLFASFLVGLAVLVVGNLVTRIVYESLVLIFSIHENLSQINTNTSGLREVVFRAAPAENAAAYTQQGQQVYYQPPADQQGQQVYYQPPADQQGQQGYYQPPADQQDNTNNPQ